VHRGTLQGHSDRVTGVAMSGDGRLAVPTFPEADFWAASLRFVPRTSGPPHPHSRTQADFSLLIAVRGIQVTPWRRYG
jgi:hypothetical protein